MKKGATLAPTNIVKIIKMDENMNTNREVNCEKLYKYTYRVGRMIVFRGVTDEEGKKYIEKMEKFSAGYMYPTGTDIVRAKLVWEGELEKSVSEKIH